ncbi:cytochrome C peroxidase [Sorangium cellulosum]|jgi:cytochrome c peroxidase|uniref:Cytochrome C peroxidase n=1 Tax=Sorangium cellulosum TaxID=56 RepID=A0A4P2PTQ8_SORCE|nr:cytochrome-c peroxidase [Sorangium cellulosum]AUX19948.1 cytochrome C peroxidase [Sorangium cellulosum]
MRWPSSLISVLLVAAGLGACDRSAENQAPPAQTAKPAATSTAAAATKPLVFDPKDVKAFKVLPAKFEYDKNPITDDKVTLGRMLWYETRLSKNHDISCNSCHDLSNYGVDNKPFSPGHKGQLGGRNSPTAYNAGHHVAQFWDGRAENLEEQAKGPILNPVEMAMPDEKRVIATLKSIPEYVKLFKAAFPDDKDPVTYDNMARAIGAFERGLVTPSRFDKYLGGDDKALTAEEKAGFHKFISLGCPTCHTGVAVGGSSFQKLGLVKEYPGLKDNGRFDHTKDEKDKFFFRVPSLRNVEKTFPYYHDGSIASLDEAVKTMAWHQLGVEAKPEEVKSIVTFLKALTGDLPTEYIKKPELPPSTATTPKADPS